MKSAQLKKLAQSISEFPTLPAVIARVMEELNNPYSSASDLTEIIRVDQAMTFRLLKIANSAYYGFPRAISSVTESIVLLGFATVRNLMLTTLMYQFNEMLAPASKAGKAGGGFNHREEWRHAVASAIAARELTRLKALDSLQHMAYLGGLMHDIGKIFFFHCLSADYARVVAAPWEQPEELCRREEKTFGADHGQAGAWIVDRWNLPQEIVGPIARHHFPQTAKQQRDLTEILHDADRIAHQAVWPKKQQQTWLASAGGMKIGSQPAAEALPRLWAAIQQELRQIEQLMAV